MRESAGTGRTHSIERLKSAEKPASGGTSETNGRLSHPAVHRCPGPGVDVEGVSPVPVQMWQGVSPVPGQMRLGVSPVPVQMRQG